MTTSLEEDLTGCDKQKSMGGKYFYLFSGKIPLIFFLLKTIKQRNRYRAQSFVPGVSITTFKGGRYG
jgi:hypothetical protein